MIQTKPTSASSNRRFQQTFYLPPPSNLVGLLLQEGDTRCVQESAAWSHPNHTLHGGGRGRVRSCRHHGVGPAEVGSSRLWLVFAGVSPHHRFMSPSSPTRCIGTIQHLKGKYGRCYSLEVKLREELSGLQQAELLHKEILRIFPRALRQER